MTTELGRIIRHADPAPQISKRSALPRRARRAWEATVPVLLASLGSATTVTVLYTIYQLRIGA